MANSLPTLSPAELGRYSRHIQLAELGVEGQRKLAGARVLVVGAGGLGSPAALYLAAAGVGTIGLVDFDEVEEHNLQRQILHDTSSVGESKVKSAGRRLRATNPLIRVVEHSAAVTVENARSLFSQYDVIVDGTDNFSARYLNNDAAALVGRPLVYGSVYKFEGQVSVFDPARGGPCYRCLFPESPPAGTAPNCGEAGVLGALCGVVGSWQALEAIKLITGVGEPLRGRLLLYDGLAQNFQTVQLTRNPACPLCGEHPTLRELRAENYTHDCEPFGETKATEEEYPLEISVREAFRRVQRAPEQTQIIDVREPYEVSICRIPGAALIPMRQIPENVGQLPKDRHLLILCHVGQRSLRVTEYLRAQGYSAVSNIAGGISAWADEIDPDMPRY